MSYTIIIPARMQSTRLPNKMLKQIGGVSIIEWTLKAAQKTKAKHVIVATDHIEIYQYLNAINADVIMTEKTHESGTDRLSEVVFLKNLDDNEIIVNWQGDEPFLPPSLIDQVSQTLIENNTSAMSTLATHIHSWEEAHDPNIVKVVLNNKKEALYFSRSLIPYPRDLKSEEKKGAISNKYHYLRHIGVYGYRAHFLKVYPSLTPSSLEITERLEQLRALSNNYQISVAITDHSATHGIDTEEDLINAQRWYEQHYIGD